MDTDRLVPARRTTGAELYIPQRHDDVAMSAAPVPNVAPASDWQHYMASIARHKWIVLAVTLVGTALGIAATRFLPPRYAARAILWIDSSVDERGREVVADQLVGSPSWTELVTSNAVLDSVVKQHRLFLEPNTPADAASLSELRLSGRPVPGDYQLRVDRTGSAFTLVYDDDHALQRGRAGDVVGIPYGFSWTPPTEALAPGREVSFTLLTPYEATLRLAKSLKVRREPGSSFLRIELRGSDPRTTTETVNAIAERVVTVASELKREKYGELSKILGEQYAHAQRGLHSAEGALTAFRTRAAERLRREGLPNVSALDAREDPTSQSSIALRVGVEQLRRDKTAIEDALRGPDGAVRTQALSAIGSVRESPELTAALTELTEKQAELRALRYRYTDESAPVQQARGDMETLEKQTVPRLAQNLVAELSKREQTTLPRVDSAFQNLREVPARALAEARLERNLSNAEALFGTVGQRFEEARLALLSSLPDVRILDAAATPFRPATSFAPLLIILSVVTSFGIAALAVTIRDRVDSRVRYPEQITREMRLPILGALPHVGSRFPYVTQRFPHGARDPSIDAMEALRGLRVRVLHAHGSDGALPLTITSPASGEGKSFVSVNLALSFAYAGYKTLLIDGDVRRGALHRSLGGEQRPGLTDVLSGDVTLEAAIQSTQYPGLTFLSSGTRMQRAPELLMAPKLREYVSRLREAYDVILVDSPPLTAGIDPLVLATATGNLLVVLRQGATDLPLAVTKLEVADSLPVRTIGAVLNDVRGRTAFRNYTYDASDYVEEEMVGASTTSANDWRNVLGGRET
jgi:capsular exopolysaccharide synthesis family protein